MKLVWLTAGSKSPEWLAALEQDFKKKISFWLPLEVVRVETQASARDQADRKKIEESKKLLEFFKPDDYVLLFDERGEAMESLKFAKRFEQVLNSGKKRIVFVIGGSYGVSDELKKRADLQISLSRFTMNHQIALAMALEQIYRAMTILKGVKYHNE